MTRRNDIGTRMTEEGTMAEITVVIDDASGRVLRVVDPTGKLATEEHFAAKPLPHTHKESIISIDLVRSNPVRCVLTRDGRYFCW